ncbi:hypothetical protein ACIP93_33635 [Streptomyces sp. NPDC088745]|uniref:hypothetical protein n=1 Tax=Streptomyces sp. NPDC088745 TaxID=3365884 RepID=UPI00381ACCC5
MPPLKPGTRVTHTVTGPDGVIWEMTYLGQNGGDPEWRLKGPRGHEHGVWVETAAAVRIIATLAPEAKPEPVDPHPGAPRTHLGFKVPDFVRAAWHSQIAQGWRLGVASAVGNLPDTRPRS